ncbi:MAG: GntP family permease [Selenomonas sp.]|nr:GntP family permease [Selenomonas sp.]MCI7329988.1 GntP family permease [Selenomonadaceae bacterium]MDD6119314.1 GntP family permease [Selenomonadaceae bacterium]MDY3915345.1 GntP family permease [Selenomonadaceae bacterium]
MEAICIALALVGLMYLAYRGWSIILIAPFMAGLAALASTFDILPVYTELYMTRLAEYVKTYYPVFLFGAVFAKLMEKGGLASSIAAKIVDVLGEKRAVLAVLLGCGVLTYGGLSVFVVAFVMYPFGAVVFKRADIPKRLLPATLWMGIFSFAMVALPGTPQIQNIIPSSYFETSTWAAPGIGLFASFLFLLIGWGWVNFRAKRLKAAGEGYGNHIEEDSQQQKNPIPWYLALLPLVLVIVLNVLLSNPFHWSWGYQWAADSLDAFAPFKLKLIAAGVGKVSAIWSISVALIISSLVAAFIGRKTFKNGPGFLSPINYSALSSGTAVLNVASGYAFGCVLVAMPGFQPVTQFLIGLADSFGPLLSAVITTNIMCGITGSASGGLTIALSALGSQWAQMATAAGIPLEVLHRIVAVASIGIDPVPHAGALVTLLAICGLTHKESYFDIIVCLGLKFLVPFACIIFYMLTGIA